MLNHDISRAKLFAIGDGNFDYYIDYPWSDKPEQEAIWYMPKPNAAGCSSGWFGDVKHIRKLINAGFWHAELTQYGKDSVYPAG